MAGNFIVGLDPAGTGNNTGWTNDQRLQQAQMGMSNMLAQQQQQKQIEAQQKLSNQQNKTSIYGIDAQTAQNAANNRTAAQSSANQLQAALAGIAGQKYGYDAQAGTAKYGYDTNARTSQYAADVGARTAQYTSNNNLAQSNYAADAQKAASMYGSDKGLAGVQYGSDAQKEAALGVAQYNLQGSNYSADQSRIASMYGSDAQKASALGVAGLNLQGSNYSADAQKAAALGVAATNAGASNYGADQSRIASMFGSQQAADASKYGSDNSLAATQYGVNAQNSRFGQALAAANSRFGAVQGMIQGAQGGLGGTGGRFDAGPMPQIDAGPALSNALIQQNVNNAVGRVDQRTAAGNADIARSAAGRGIGGGAQSPLVQSLMQANNAAGAGQGADAELNFRTQAAGMNAQQTLASQQARYNAWQGTQGLNLQSEQIANNYNAALISALAGMAGSIPSA